MKYLSAPFFLTFIKINPWFLSRCIEPRFVYILTFHQKKKSWLERHKLSSAYSCIKPLVIQQLPQTFHTRSLHMYYSWPTFIEVLTKVSFSFSENAHNSSLTSSGYIKTESQRPSLNFTYPGWPLKLGWRARIITRFVTPSMIILQESKRFIPVISQLYTHFVFIFVCFSAIVVHVCINKKLFTEHHH